MRKSGHADKFKRPDISIVSEAIPLFVIGRNRAGMWVAKESEGKAEGTFLFKASAIRFAKRASEPGGCAFAFVPSALNRQRLQKLK
ncbi:MAG: hypothetical protein ACXWKC_05965 [Xanthobacteraceae bacterium]